MWGSKDASCSKAAVEKIHTYVPNFSKIELEGKGHWLLDEAKDAIAKNVLDFVDEKLQRGQAKL